MGVASKATWVLFRCMQLISAAIVVGLVGNYIRLASEYHAATNNYLIYTQVIAVMSVIIAIVFSFPWSYAFYAFPLDFIMFILWMVAFGLQVHLAGGAHCDSTWYWQNWGWFYGRHALRTFPPNFNQSMVGTTGCNTMRTVWAFSFIGGIFFLMNAAVGLYRCMRGVRRDDTRNVVRDTTGLDEKEDPIRGGNAGDTHTNGGQAFNTETGERL